MNRATWSANHYGAWERCYVVFRVKSKRWKSKFVKQMMSISNVFLVNMIVHAVQIWRIHSLIFVTFRSLQWRIWISRCPSLFDKHPLRKDKDLMFDSSKIYWCLTSSMLNHWKSHILIHLSKELIFTGRTSSRYFKMYSITMTMNDRIWDYQRNIFQIKCRWKHDRCVNRTE